LASQAGPYRSELFKSKMKRKQWAGATQRGNMSDVGVMSKEYSVVNIFRGWKVRVRENGESVKGKNVCGNATNNILRPVQALRCAFC